MPLSPIVAGHILECIVFTSCRDQVGMNVLHFKVNTVTVDTTPDDYVQQIEADFNGSWKGWLADQAEWRGVSLRDLTVSPLEVAAFSGAQRGPGLSGQLLPTQVSGLVVLKTAVAGPGGRGRIYLPFPGAEMLDDGGDDSPDGDVSSGGLVVMQTLIDDIKGPETITATPFSMNWSLCLSVTENAVQTQDNLPLRSIHPSTEFATQKRRGAYGKKNTLPAELS